METEKNSVFFKTKKYIGIDIDSNILKKAKEKFPKYKFVKENMANFNIKKYSTDVVLSTNTFQHINSSHRKKAFKNLISIIKKNGYLIVDSDINDLLDFKLKKK